MNVCKVCKHPERATIDSARARGVPYRKIAAQVGGVSPAAVDRHKRHLPSTMVQARNVEAVTQATNLLSRIETLLRESEAIARSAKRAKEWPAATAALREARSGLELLARLRGELQNAPSVKVGVQLVSPGNGPIVCTRLRKSWSERSRSRFTRSRMVSIRR